VLLRLTYESRALPPAKAIDVFVRPTPLLSAPPPTCSRESYEVRTDIHTKWREEDEAVNAPL